MDNHLADNFQAVNNEIEANQATEDCLRNPLIVRKILEHFSSKELLQISLVNKFWKYEARSLVSQRGNVVANLMSKQLNGNTCQAAVAFMSDLPQLGAAPFFGIQFRKDHHHRYQVCSGTPENLVRFSDVNLVDQLSLKSVSVQMSGRFHEFRRCPAFLLAQKVLQKVCLDLEEFEIEISDERRDYAEEVVEACYFPRLKILRVTCDTFHMAIERYLGALLARAPNLKILHTGCNMNSVLHLLQGTSVEFVYTTCVHAPFDDIPDNVISGTRFEDMSFGYIDQIFNTERFNRIAPILLQASRTTIRSLSIDAVLALPFMCYGIRLENVRNLLMDHHIFVNGGTHVFDDVIVE